MNAEFARGDPHDNRVPIGLTADEYLFLRDQSADEGCSQSALIRRLLNEYRNEVAMKKLSVHERYENSAELAQGSAQEIPHIVGAAVTAALRAYREISGK